MLLPLTSIRPNTVALRPANKEDPDYRDLVASIKDIGVLNAISVVERTDSNGKWYELVDGLQRFTAAGDVGLLEIPVTVVSLDEQQIHIAQLMANLHRVATKPKQYAEHLVRVMAINRSLTKNELARKIAKSPAWIDQILSLDNILPALGSLVDNGDIKLTNAIQLAKLPQDEQEAYATFAQTDKADEFQARVTSRLGEIRKAQREGREAKPQEFTPNRSLRKLSEFATMLDSDEHIKQLLISNNITDAFSAAKLAIAWALRVDPSGVEAQKTAYDLRKKQEADAKEVKRIERENKAAAKTAAVTA